ncbi:MAG: creatininase family protein [Haloarculaceae archaeon]
MEFDSAGVSWAAKTAGEIGALGDADGSVAVVPVGSVEQHGDHLPVATDTILAEAVAAHGAERVADDVPILVTPPVWAGNSPHHVAFGGTISVGVHGLLDLLERVAGSVLDNGFDALLFVNGHGGNRATVGDAVSTVGAARPDAQVLGVTYFELADSFVHDVRESDAGGMAHAGEFETSLLLHLRPALVDEDAMDADPMDEPYERAAGDMFDEGPLAVYRSFEEYSASGAVGDPQLASAEKGERIFESLGDELESLLRGIHERNR